MRKLLFILSVVLLLIPSAFAISIDSAVNTGEAFIKQSAVVGHKGIVIEDYNVHAVKAYQNETYFRIIYELSSNGKYRYVMVDIVKDNGEIFNVYLSGQHDSIILF